MARNQDAGNGLCDDVAGVCVCELVGFFEVRTDLYELREWSAVRCHETVSRTKLPTQVFRDRV